MSAIILEVKHLRSFNYKVDHPRQFTVHAEESIIAKAAKRGVPLHNKTIVVYRKGGQGNSYPCTKCQHLIRKAGLGKLIFLSSGEWVEETLK